jgi:hypothetical protein
VHGREPAPSIHFCPTDPVSVEVDAAPYWWSKPLNELRLTTFIKPFFHDGSKTALPEPMRITGAQSRTVK